MAAILITGVSGFVGYHMAKALLERGEEVIGFDSLHESYYEVSLKKARLDQLHNYKNFVFFPIDLSNYSYLDRFKDKVDRILHLAAEGNVAFCKQNPDTFFKNNFATFHAALEFARSLPVLKNFLYMSTSHIYGDIFGDAPSEDFVLPKPQSLYTASKYSNECVASAYASSYNLPITGIRLYHTYGPWGRPDTMPFKIADALREGKKINIFSPRYKQMHAMLYIDDLVNGLTAALDKSPENTTNSVYNLGPTEHFRVDDMIETLAKALGYEPQFNYAPLPKDELALNKCANIDKAKKELNFAYTVDIKTGLLSFIDWYKNVYTHRR